MDDDRRHPDNEWLRDLFGAIERTHNRLDDVQERLERFSALATRVERNEREIERLRDLSSRVDVLVSDMERVAPKVNGAAHYGSENGGIYLSPGWLTVLGIAIPTIMGLISWGVHILWGD